MLFVINTKNSKSFKIFASFIFIAILLGSILFLWYNKNRFNSALNGSRSQLEPITYCSDVCPDNTRTFMVYRGIENQEQCEEIKGQTILDSAWGGYIGCRPRPIGDPAVVNE
jgi:hypothetical protein